ncbi:hypothetical protein QF012_005868, partial [Pseudomonas laurylsulfatiphila]
REICRSWLASDGVRNSGARLKGLIAGKPAPTGDGVQRLFFVGAGLPAMASAQHRKA